MDDRNYTIETARDGRPTLRVRAAGKDLYLHSAHRPMTDARILEGCFNPEKYDMLVVLGAGLGYHLQGLRDITDNYRRIIVVDALQGLETEIARVPETAFLTARGNISLLAGLTHGEVESALESLLDIEEGRGLQVLEHPQSVRAFPEYYGEIRSLIERLINRRTGDMATRSALGLRFFKNAVTNLCSMGMHRPAAALAGRFAGLPALAVTSGPSLVKSLGALRGAQRRLFIIAVDSALPVLGRAGIVPDFCVSIDPQPYILEHFMRAGAPGALPLVTMTSEPRVFSMRPGILSLNSHPVSQFLEEALPGLMGSFHSATGTVAGDAVQAALAMGFGAIGLAGYDFSFPRLEIYARGSAYQDRYAGLFQDRFSPVETQNLRYIMKSSGGTRSGPLFSRKSFLRYRESLEDRVLSKAGGMIFTVGPAGLPLKGAPALGLADFLARHAGPDIDKPGMIRDALAGAKSLAELAPPDDIIRLLDGGVMERLAAASLGEGNPRLGWAADFARSVLRSGAR
jgi:hypothetical protein